MAHKLSNILIGTGKKKFSLPKINGRFGLSFSFGEKEVFIGILLTDVILEQMTKRRVVKIPKAESRVYGFDVFSGQGSPEA